jgi:hypothetical protein
LLPLKAKIAPAYTYLTPHHKNRNSTLSFFPHSIHFISSSVVMLRVHCGIYNSSYNVSNISYLNLAPPPLSFISLLTNSWDSFNRYHFSFYIHVYTVFEPNSPSHALSPPPPPSHCYGPLRQDLFCLPVLRFCKTNKK